MSGDYIFLSFLFKGVCDIHSCIDMNPGISYGHMINFNPNAYGTYCGEGMMCMQSNCKPKAESGLPASALAVVEGGWGEWSSFTGAFAFYI